MRPLVVLILVLGAIAALLFALTSLTGNRRGGNGDQLVAVKPDAPKGKPQALVEPVEPAQRTETDAAADESRQAVLEGEVRAPVAGAVEGTVVDAEDQPIAEARVSLMNTRQSSIGDAFYALRDREPPRPVAAIETDETGSFRFEHLDPRKDWTVIVHHDRYMPEQRPIPVPENGVWTEKIILRPGVTCSGTVRDGATMQPIVEATLVVDDPIAAFSPRKKSATRIEVQSDANGRYTFYNVRPGQQTLTLSAPGYATQVHNNFSLVSVAASPTRFKNRQPEAGIESKEQDFDLQPGLVIAGRVVGPDQRGFAGIEVEAVSQSGTIGSRGSGTSAKTGEFLIEGLAEGIYTVRVEVQGFESQPAQRVEAGDTNVLIELFEQASVSGRVLDPQGNPMTNFTCKVRAVNEVSNNFGAVVAQKAFQGAKDGAFEIGGVPEGSYVVEGIAHGYASSFSEPFSATQGLETTDVVVRMSKGGSLRGTVLDSYSSAPVVGAEIKTVDNMWVEGDFFELFAELEPSALTKAVVRTDAEGRFEIEVLTPGDYQVQIKAKGYTTVFLNDVSIVDGQCTDLPVQILSKGAIIRGVVYGKDGRIAPGASVSLVPVDNNLLWSHKNSRADATGTYVIDNAQAGNYKLSASRPDQNSASPFDTVIDLRQSEIEITIEDGAQYEFDLYMGRNRGGGEER